MAKVIYVLRDAVQETNLPCIVHRKRSHNTASHEITPPRTKSDAGEREVERLTSNMFFFRRAFDMICCLDDSDVQILPQWPILTAVLECKQNFDTQTIRKHPDIYSFTSGAFKASCPSIGLQGAHKQKVPPNIHDQHVQFPPETQPHENPVLTKHHR